MTRSSSARKGKSVKKHSKYSLMRRKLTLRPEPSPPHYETVNREEEIATTDNNGEQHVEEVKNEEGVGHDEKKKLFQRASPMKLVRLSKKIQEDQKTLVRNSDYGGLLDIKCSKLHPELCQFLMDSFDHNTCMLVFPDRGSIPLNEESVYDVLGVAWGDLEVLYLQDNDATQFMTEQLGNTGNKQPTIASLEEKLVGMKKADKKFLRFFLTYAMTSVLAPTTGVRISPRVYPSLVNIKQAKQLNMCKFVLMIICKALKPGGKGNAAPCMLYLMVKYLDSLQLQGMDICQEGTRVAVWTNAMVTKAIKQDIGADGCFGAAPLKPEFANTEAAFTEAIKQDIGIDGCFGAEPLKPEFATTEAESERVQELQSEPSIVEKEEEKTSSSCEVGNEPTDDVLSESEQEEGETILFSDPDKIAKFIRKNIPKDSTAEDKAKYSQAVEYACHGFEASLQVLLKTLSGKSVMQSPTASPQGMKAPATRNSKNKSNGGANTRSANSNPQKMASSSSTSCDNVLNCGNEESKQTQKSVPPMDENVHIAEPVLEHQEELNSGSEMLVRRNKRAKMTEGDSSRQQDVMSAEIKMHQQVEKPVVMALSTKETDVNAGTSRTEKQTAAVNTEGTRDAFPEKLQCLASEVTKRATTPTVPFQEEGAKPDSIASLVRHMRSINAATLPDMCETAGNKENLPPDPGILGSKTNVAADTQEKAADIDDSAPASFSQEGDGSSNSSERMGTAEFLKFVGMTPPGRKVNIPQFEEHVFLDFGLGNLATEAFDGIRKNLKEFDMEEAGHGLPSMIDGRLHPECEKLLSEMEPKPMPIKRKKTVTFADQDQKRMKIPQTTMSSPSKYRTRAAAREEASCTANRVDAIKESLEKRKLMKTKLTAGRSPTKKGIADAEQLGEGTQQQEALADDKIGCSKVVGATSTLDAQAGPSKQARPADSPSHRLTTTSTSNAEAAREEDQELHLNAPGKDISGWYDPTNRKVIFDSDEEERKKEAMSRAPDAPSFELFIDTPPDANGQEQEPAVQAQAPPVQKLVAAEQVPAKQVAGDTLKGVPVGAHQAECSRGTADPSDASITPKPHEYMKRSSTVGKFEKSPYINVKNQKNFNVSKTVEDIYNKVCRHGSRSRSQTKDNIVIDVDSFFIHLGALADSVAPGKKLVNMVAEIGIHIINEENQNPKKVIMPLRVATYLMDARFELKDVIRVFDEPNRLDHQELICFPTLRQFALYPKEPSGHYWLVVLNIPAERFEIIDSLASEGEALMMGSCHILIAGIKTMWNRYYSRSKIQIAEWPIEVICSPRQTNVYDCGFFTLRNLEEKHGRKVASFTQKDLPNIRKLYMDKWLNWGKNKANWSLYVT